MPDFATIEQRYKGPPGSGNGGYSAGIIGSLIGDCAEVTLTAPPPLDRPLAITERDGEWTLTDGEQLIAQGHATEFGLDVPAPPSIEQARAAESEYTGHAHHIFPGCFVCGPDRAEHDGLRLFTGQVEGREVVASHWHPAQDIAGSFGSVMARVVWAALDCPTYFGAQLGGAPPHAVLGRLAARQLSPVSVDREHIVIGWPIGIEERKFFGGSAIYTSEGELCAYAKGTWIAIDPEASAFAVS